MLDLKAIRDDPAPVREALARRRDGSAERLERVLALDVRRRELLPEAEGIKARQNQASQAIAAAKKAGAVVQSKPGQSTDVLVRGRPNALQIAGTAGGLKLMEIRRLAARGHAITVIDERQFWRLVTPKRRHASRS